MRFIFFELHNYAGIMNGMGIETLTIDFSKSKHVITLICGKNGVGKSTLLKALSPLPDGSDDYVSGRSAYKKMSIIDESNRYDIFIHSDVNASGNRQTTKASIIKDGRELNPTENISSYKEVLFSEFELDANYITLARLSSEDRGMAMKTPAERKKFIANILSTIDTYNAINKSLTQRVNVFKSHINNLEGKIKNIGERSAVEAAMRDIDMRYKTKLKEKERLMAEKGATEAVLQSEDPSGKNQEEYQRIADRIRQVVDSIDALEKIVGDKTIDEVEESIEKHKETIRDAESNRKYNDDKSIDLTSRISAMENEIDIDTQKLENLKNGFEINNLKDILETLRKETESLEAQFIASQIPYETISRDEFTLLVEILQNIRDNIDAISSYYSNEDISLAIQNISSGIDPEKLISDLIRSNNILVDDISKLEISVDVVNRDIELMENLKQRPKNCKIDSCPFVSELIELKNHKDEIIEKQKNINSAIAKSRKDLANNEESIKAISSRTKLIKQIEEILTVLNSNKKLIAKFPTVRFFSNTNEVLNRIQNGNLFPEIDELLRYVDIFNEAETLKDNKNKLVKLEADYKVASIKAEQIETTEKSIQGRKNELSSLKSDRDCALNNVKLADESITYHTKLLSDAMYEHETLIKLEELRKEKDDLKKQYQDIKDSIAKIKDYITRLDSIDMSLKNIEDELPALEQERDRLSYSLTNMNTYTAELEMYKEKYNVTNTLKKYSNPTTGIQTLYMNMYMGKTLTMANELLGMMFGGEYSLLPYVINESEFRIPFIGNGLPVDDISSGSTSQLCIIGTIMNLVLLYQASSKYSIVSLDEVDGGLDSHNRYDFIPTLYKLIEILNIKQLMMISHNIEADLSNVDVIKLKGYEDDDMDLSNANVIYDYNG